MVTQLERSILRAKRERDAFRAERQEARNAVVIAKDRLPAEPTREDLAKFLAAEAKRLKSWKRRR